VIVYSLKQFFLCYGLGQIPHAPYGKSPGAVFLSGKRAYKHHGDFGKPAVFLDIGAQVIAVGAGHHDIQQDKVGHYDFDFFQRALGTRQRYNTVVFPPKKQLDEFQYVLVVINH